VAEASGRADAFFRWVGSTDPRAVASLVRPAQTKLRIAQWTDLHVPGDMELSRRLRDLLRPHSDISALSHQLSALSNELGHQYRKDRRAYTNMLKKVLVGLRALEVDHLIITGDLVHCSLEAEFLEVRAVLELTGWLDPARLTVIPGNHDRFNLYEHLPSRPMEAFFDVVDPHHPRFKRLDHGVALLEIDSNSDRVHDRHTMERYLPNSVGCLYPEALSKIEAGRGEVEGMRLLCLIHHHVSSDWYPRVMTRDMGGLMDPARGVDDLSDLCKLIDKSAIILHGHIHEVMPMGYTWRGHLVGNPGGFAEARRLNLLDVDTHGEIVMSQVELRM
jgi:predicted phosphodiesterase